MRISAQLVSAEDGCHLWSEGYDRSTADVFAVQDEIARSVVDRLKVTLAEFPRQPLIRQHTQNPRAYQCYLKGRFYWTRRYHGGLKAALEQFQKAIEEDAGYAMAYAGLADAYSFMGIYSVQTPRTAFASASAAVERALAIDPDLAGGAHVAGIHQASQRLELAGSRARVPPRAGARSNADAAADLSFVAHGAARRSRRRGRSRREGRRRWSRCRLSSMPAPLTRCFSRGVTTRPLTECEKSLEVDPNFIFAIHVMGMCRAQQSRLTRGDRNRRADRVDVRPRAPFYLGVLGHYYARNGATDKVHDILEELAGLAGTRYVPPHCQCTSTQERTTWTGRSSGRPRPMRTGRHPSTIFRLSSKTSTAIPVTAPTCGGWGCGSSERYTPTLSRANAADSAGSGTLGDDRRSAARLRLD